MRVHAAVESLSERAYPVPGNVAVPEKSPVATPQRWACALPVVRSVLQCPSVVCMVSRDDAAQHPPFGGDAPAAMGDGGWGMGSSHTQAAVRGILNVCLNSACDRYQPGRSPQHRESPGARERTIVSLIAQGQPNEEITRDLAIGVPLPGQIRKHSTFM